MNLVWQYAVRSEVGLVRGGNEDSAYAGQRLIAVADGMGGHAAGEVASAATIATLTRLDERMRPDWDALEVLRRAVRSANSTLRDIVAADSELYGMGTTVTAAVLDAGRLVLVHVGDSRAYRLRDGQLQQLTHDHTYVQQLVDDGRLRPEETSTHPQRSVITRALDGREDLEIDVVVERAHPGDRYLLCSDGLSGVVSDDTIARTLADGAPDAVVDQLVALALRAGGPDNITCIVADVTDADGVTASPGQVVGAADDSGVVSRSRVPDGAAAVALDDDVRQPTTAPVSAASPPVDAADGRRDSEDPRDRARALNRRRGAVVAAAAAAVVLIGGVAGWAVVRSQYYVGTADGQVAIFRGIPGSVAGIALSSVHHESDLPVATLPDFAQEEVQDGIHADGLDDAEAILDRLRNNAQVGGPGTPDCPTIPTVRPAPGASAQSQPSPLAAPSPQPITPGQPTADPRCSTGPIPLTPTAPSVVPASPS